MRVHPSSVASCRRCLQKAGCLTFSHRLVLLLLLQEAELTLDPTIQAAAPLIAQLNTDRTLATMLNLHVPQLRLDSQAIKMQHNEGGPGLWAAICGGFGWVVVCGFWNGCRLDIGCQQCMRATDYAGDCCCLPFAGVGGCFPMVSSTAQHITAQHSTLWDLGGSQIQYCVHMHMHVLRPPVVAAAL